MTKLCPRGKAAAKRKFAVYPSAYANAYASKICAGKIKDPSGTKRKDFKGPKPAAKGAMMNKPKGAVFGFLFRKKKKEKEADSKETKESLIKKNVGKKNKRLKELKDEIGMSTGGGADTGRIGELKSRVTVGLDRIARREKQRRKFLEDMKGQRPSKPDPSRKLDPAPRPGRKKKQYRPRPAARPLPPPPPNRPSKPQYISRATGGDAKIKKVIKGLNKASALHKGQAKTLGTLVNKKAVGGMADYYKDLM